MVELGKHCMDRHMHMSGGLEGVWMVRLRIPYAKKKLASYPVPNFIPTSAQFPRASRILNKDWL